MSYDFTYAIWFIYMWDLKKKETFKKENQTNRTKPSHRYWKLLVTRRGKGHRGRQNARRGLRDTNFQ